MLLVGHDPNTAGNGFRNFVLKVSSRLNKAWIYLHDRIPPKAYCLLKVDKTYQNIAGFASTDQAILESVDFVENKEDQCRRNISY